MSTHLYL